MAARRGTKTPVTPTHAPEVIEPLVDYNAAYRLNRLEVAVDSLIGLLVPRRGPRRYDFASEEQAREILFNISGALRDEWHQVEHAVPSRAGAETRA